MEIIQRVGPRRSGKTTECIHSMIRHATITPLENAFVILPTQRMSRYFIDTLMDISKDLLNSNVMYNTSKSEIIINGCQFNIISTDSFQDKSVHGLRREEYTTVFVDNCLNFQSNKLDETLDILRRIANIKKVYAYGTEDSL